MCPGGYRRRHRRASSGRRGTSGARRRSVLSASAVRSARSCAQSSPSSGKASWRASGWEACSADAREAIAPQRAGERASSTQSTGDNWAERCLRSASMDASAPRTVG